MKDLQTLGSTQRLSSEYGPRGAALRASSQGSGGCTLPPGRADPEHESCRPYPHRRLLAPPLSPSRQLLARQHQERVRVITARKGSRARQTDITRHSALRWVWFSVTARPVFFRDPMTWPLTLLQKHSVLSLLYLGEAKACKQTLSHPP